MNSSNNKKNVIIIGGGTGGVIVANILSRKAAKDANITLLTAKDKVFYEPDNLFRLFDKNSMNSQYKLVSKAVSKKVNIELERVNKVDPEKKKVYCESGKKISYDYLVLASGATYDYDRVPGYKEAAHNFHDGKATLKLREAIANFEGGDIVMGIADLPFKCPVAPLEFIFMAHSYFKKRKMLDKVKFHITSPLPRVFSIENVSDKVTKKYEKMDVEIHEFFNTEEIDPEKKLVISMEGDELPYDLLVMVPPHQGQQFLIDSELSDDEGWVPTNRETLRHDKFEDIWAVGDTTNLPVSKAGAAAHHQAKVIGANLASVVKGKDPKDLYHGGVQCFLMTSLSSSVFLDFNYKRPPRSFFLKDFFGRGWYLSKKLFKPMYFRLILSGRV
ncbi:MAG: NAD(P)/FAD-dependent oxidoreductase [Candidatus Hodarchaeales archaeon]|jgi:sulfide:quinone oxidoreductase